MRIGIVLFGHLRSYKQTTSSFENLKNTLSQSGKVDVFCHTWDIEESVTQAWWKDHKPDDPPPATVDAKRIEQTYSPALYFVEPSRQFDDKDYSVNSTIPIPGILSMLYSQMQAFKLLEQYERQSGSNYDVVVKARYDLLYEIAEEFPNCISTDDRIFLPSSNPYELAGSCSDVFAIGQRESMAKYFGFCENFRQALSVYHQKGFQRLIPELCMTVYLDSKNIRREGVKGLRLSILRMGGEKFQINTDKNFEANMPLCFYRDTIDRNKDLFMNQQTILPKNTENLIRKYMSWIDTTADKKDLQEYVDFYNGKWISPKKIKKLATKGKNSRIFSSYVMKNFFEECLRNASYNYLKKVLVVSVLTAVSNYGFFFFRILKNITFNKKQ